MKVKSVVIIKNANVQKITSIAQKTLEQTAEALHTEVVQAQVFPRDTGHLQNESTFVDTSESASGKVKLVSTAPYARRVYFHPEYNFKKTENANARGKWYEDWINGSKQDFVPTAFRKLLKRNGDF